VPQTDSSNPAEPFTVPPLDDETAGLIEDLSGIHTGIDLIREGILHLTTAPLTRDQTQTIVSALADSGSGTDVLALIAAAITRLADADTNPCLRDLDPDTIADLRRISGAVAVDLQTTAPRDLAGEIAIRIDPYATDAYIAR
jgi:hypothetical protein